MNNHEPVPRASAPSVRRVHALDGALLDALADVLIDCVDGGASVSFMHPLSREQALAFWHRVASGIEGGQRALLVADDASGPCGTVQRCSLNPITNPTAPTCRSCSCTGARAAGASARH